MYITGMADMKFEWDSQKNEWLKKERGISFEQIVFHLMQGDIWRMGDHPDQDKYPGQKIYFIIIDDYVYLVPYVQHEDEIILKTIIPSRKATKDYRKESEGTVDDVE